MSQPASSSFPSDSRALAKPVSRIAAAPARRSQPDAPDRGRAARALPMRDRRPDRPSRDAAVNCTIAPTSTTAASRRGDLELRVPLRMREHRRDARAAEAEHGVREAERPAVVRELDQHVIGVPTQPEPAKLVRGELRQVVERDLLPRAARRSARPGSSAPLVVLGLPPPSRRRGSGSPTGRGESQRFS